MLTGWIPKFKHGRGLNGHELAQHLPYKTPQSFSPDEAIGMTKFNSTFVEFVDRTFKIKGMAATAIAVCLSVFLLGTFLRVVVGDYQSLAFPEWLTTVLILAPVFVGGVVLL